VVLAVQDLAVAAALVAAAYRLVEYRRHPV
jgi:hypothetical protein